MAVTNSVTSTASINATVALNVMPSISKQKTFICENVNFLDRGAKIEVMSRIILDMGDSYIKEKTIGETPEVDINLDIIAEKNPELLLQIYNIIYSYWQALKTPFKQN